MPSLVLKPGMFVRLKQQPWDLPDFVLEHWWGDTAWIRQQTWGPQVSLRVRVTQLAIPGAPASESATNALKLIKVVEATQARERLSVPDARTCNAHTSTSIPKAK
ncbi:MAG: hypothetical protein AAFU71_01605 [Cyanobacteria bacterium J06632_22]